MSMVSKRRNNHWLMWALCGGMLSLLVACGSTKQELELIMHSTNRLNLTEGGQPSPLVVRIYILRFKDRFHQSTFKELWKRDSEVLGDGLIRRMDMTLKPDDEHIVEMTADQEKEENYIGIMGLFRKHIPNMWRMLIPIEEPGFFSFGTPEVKLRFDENSLRPFDDD